MLPTYVANIRFMAIYNRNVLSRGQLKMPERNKRAKFVKLAESRVNRAIKELRLIGNLSNRSAYEFSDEDIRKIFRTLQKELEGAKARFVSGGKSGSDGFRIE